MAVKISAIRGMNDILPQNTGSWQRMENILKSTLQSYGFSEIRFPIVEKTGLFCRAIGEVTDVVEKEMYTFEDRDGDSLSLRPEGTASCVRACLENSLIYNQEQRLWYIGPMFRHERPQKGRYRQFHQFGCEVFGVKGPDIDAEMIAMTYSIWQKLGIEKSVRLELNSLGSLEERAEYKKSLVAFLEEHKDALDEDSKRRMYSNPLRVLDTKNPDVIEILKDAPKLSNYFKEETKAHFGKLCAYLDVLGISYTINERLVRGLDYYNLTVFEWVTTELGSQGTVCGGGRYDGLVEQLGGKPTCAIGFAIGLERLLLLLESLELSSSRAPVDYVICYQGENTDIAALKLGDYLRKELTDTRIMTCCGGGKLKKQLAFADKVNAKLALIIGEEELANNTVTVKNLSLGEQASVKQDELASYLNSLAK